MAEKVWETLLYLILCMKMLKDCPFKYRTITIMFVLTISLMSSATNKTVKKEKLKNENVGRKPHCDPIYKYVELISEYVVEAVQGACLVHR